MLKESLLALIREPLFNEIVSTLAVVAYSATLSPGIWRELFSRREFFMLGKYRR